jgi:sorbitol-specific phosphotransferase system component IIC
MYSHLPDKEPGTYFVWLGLLHEVTVAGFRNQFVSC